MQIHKLDIFSSSILINPNDFKRNFTKYTTFPVFKIESGSLEFLKWLGILFMTLDHVNRFLFVYPYNFAYNWGRLAMPIFTFVFVYNIANKPFNSADYSTTCLRLIIFGLLATPAYNAMLNFNGFIPLNILFTLLTIALMIYLFERKQTSLLFFVFFIGSYCVDYSWPGVFLGFSCWLFCDKPSWFFLSLSILACSALYYINHNYWALLAVPIIFLASQIHIKIPRCRYLFWLYYPIHLTGLWLAKILFNPFLGAY